MKYIKTFKKFKEEMMYPYAYTSLRSRYPANEGWEIKFKDNWESYIPDYVIERIDNNGKIHRIIAEVKAEKKVFQAHINQLNAYVRNLSGNNVSIDGKIMIVPSGCDTSLIPNDIKIIYLRKFIRNN